MPHLVDLDRANREECRWRILRMLDATRPNALSENVIHRIVVDLGLPYTPTRLRRELDYLSDKRLVLITKRDRPTWMIELTAEGVDVVEYTVPAPAGIDRPNQYEA